MFPFSFREFLDYKGIEDERIDAGGGTIEVVPAWRFLLELPEASE